VATILPPPLPPPINPEKEKLYELLRSRQEKQQQQSEAIVPGLGYIEDGPGLVPEGSSEFGLTAEDALFIEYDIRKAIEDFDSEHGFEGVGNHDEHSNFIHPADKGKELDKKRRKTRPKSKSSAQDVAIAKGLIKIRQSSSDNSEEGCY
jgi:hypothetical protein